MPKQSQMFCFGFLLWKDRQMETNRTEKRQTRRERKVRRKRRKQWQKQRRQQMRKQPGEQARQETKRKESPVMIWAAAAGSILLGIGIFLYPLISNYFAEQEQNKVIDHYVATVEDTSREEMQATWEAARIYNENIAGDPVHDPFLVGSGYAIPDNYEEVLDMEDGIMCYLEIPKLNLKLPVYHGTSEEVLKKGVGHLEMTALPIGGENRRSVLTGHRGLPQAELFTRLDEMKTGDEFYLHVLDEIHAYKVKETKTVKPEQLQELTIMPQGEDLVTLVTCTPYGMNTHRLLVTGERTEYIPENKQKEENASLLGKLMPWKYSLIGILAAAAIIGVIRLIWTSVFRRNGRKRGVKRKL